MPADLLMVHIAIPVVLLIHGMVLSALLIRRRPLPASHDPLVLVVVTGFVLSLLFNILVGGALVLLDIPVQYTLTVIFVADAVLIAIWLRNRVGTIDVKGGSYAIWIVVSTCFAIMILNGGLISILADSWWHMIYANRISEVGSIFLERHHLTGAHTSAYQLPYEPGWHINLVLISALADAPLPLVWHAVGAWCAAFIVLAYYHFARVLIENPGVAVLSAVLFVITLGGINSYLRVSPWPGNVGFVALYLLLASTFTSIGRLERPRTRILDSFLLLRSLYDIVKRSPYFTGLCIACVLLIAGLHLAEGLWFVASLAFYSFVLSCVGNSAAGTAVKDRHVLQFVWIWFFGLWGLAVIAKHPERMWDVGFVLAALVLIRMFAAGWKYTGATAYGHAAKNLMILCGAAGVIWFFVDFEHLWRLFRPGGGPVTDEAYIPMYVVGHFDTWVNLPRWEHQLRAGLLFSGIAGVAGSIWLVRTWRNRAGLFLFATATMTLMVLISPYLFTFFGSLVKLTGVYRFQVLIFHPIILACCFWLLTDRIFELPGRRQDHTVS